MKRYAFIAALAALSAGTAAYAQQPAGAPEGGISPEMLAAVSYTHLTLPTMAVV